jgi:hypothetical protein
MRATIVFSVLIALLSAGLVGCHKESPKGGPGKDVVKEHQQTKVETGPGGEVTRKEERTTEVGTDKSNTFAVKDPGTVHVKQGESKDVTISIDRGRKFEQAVTLTFKPDAGIKVAPETVTIPGKDHKAEVHVSADPKATVGSHSVEVKGNPETGASTALKIAIDVKEKK